MFKKFLLLFLLLILLFSFGCPENGTGKAIRTPAKTIVDEPVQPVCVPSLEVCDGIDNDCDGKVNEGGVCESAMVKYEDDSLLKHYALEKNIVFYSEMFPSLIAEEINKKITEAGTLWTVKENKISKLSEFEKKSLFGLIATDEDLKKLKDSEATHSLKRGFETLPDFFDWRNYQGKDYITPIRDQGSCGSCWAFGAVAVLEGQVNAYYNNPDLDLDLSEQDLVSCYLGAGCGGAYDFEIEELFSDYYQNVGIATEDCFSYTATNNDCSNKCVNWQDDAWKILGYQSVPLTVEDIKWALINYGPVEVGMEIYEDFYYYYESGIYSHVTGYLLGHHAVTIVGFGKYDGMDYWIVKNSWGTGWGEDGYFRILVGDSGIDSWFAFAVTEPNPPTTQNVICTDSDSDGYCYWGLGEKPTIGCPTCSDLGPDCDDSNNSIYKYCNINTELLGTLTVNSNPSEAQVFVQDQNTGKYIHRGTTPNNIQLNVGTRNIKITKTDYEDFITSVNINEEQTTQLDVNLLFTPKLISPLNNDIFRLGDILEIIGIVPEYYNYYKIEYELSEAFGNWNLICNGSNHVINGFICSFDTSVVPHNFIKGVFVNLKLTAHKNNGEIYESLLQNIYLDPALKKGWPIRFEPSSDGVYGFYAGDLDRVVYDLDNDGNQEIILSLRKDNYDKVLALNYDGSIKWEYELGSYQEIGYTISIPVVEDMDNDGFGEVIVRYAYLWGQNTHSTLFAINHNGNLIWAKDIPPDYLPTITIADLTNDINKEIIIKGNATQSSLGPEQIVILNNKGEILYQWSFEDIRISSYFVGSPAVGNFDDDSELELVVAGPSKNAGPIVDAEGHYIDFINEGVIFVYNVNGSIVDGWPQYVPGYILASPVVGDIDNNGRDEIIVGLSYVSDFIEFPNESFGGLYAFNRDGNVLPGWPIERGWNFWSTPSLGDVDGDGTLEIAFSRLGSATYLVDYKGNVLSGWPQYTAWNDYRGSLMSDIDSDGSLDVITTAGGIFSCPYDCGGVYAWDSSGNSLAGFPKVTETDAQTPASLADIDNDGLLELIASSALDYDLITNQSKNRSSLYVWDLNYHLNQNKMPWPQFQHDAQHTGLYTKPFLCGNADGDEMISVSDVVFLISYIFSNGSAPQPVLAGDANGDGSVDITDVVYLIGYIFSGGPAPCQAPLTYKAGNYGNWTENDVWNYTEQSSGQAKEELLNQTAAK